MDRRCAPCRRAARPSAVGRGVDALHLRVPTAPTLLLPRSFCCRIGLFRNQPGDELLAKADVVLTVGYDPVEYGPEARNAAHRASIIHLDDYPCDIDNYYQPDVELRGNVEVTLDSLASLPCLIIGGGFFSGMSLYLEAKVRVH